MEEQETKFCRMCGEKIKADARFCRYCGYEFKNVVQPKEENEPPKETVRVCEKCGNEVNPQAAFCRFCGTKLEAPSQNLMIHVQPVNEEGRPIVHDEKELDKPESVHEEKKPNMPESLHEEKKPASEVSVQILERALHNVLKDGMLASPGSGEMAFNDSVLLNGAKAITGENISGAVTQRAQAVLSPVITCAKGMGAFLGGMIGVIKNPKALLPYLIPAALWIVLPILKMDGTENEVTNLLSVLSFSDGGLNRSAVGMVGGMIGKGSVAVLFGSIFSGGIGATFGGIGAIFSRKGEKRSFIWAIIGVVAGVGLTLFYTGIETANAGTCMAGISGVILSLQSMGKKGFLYSLAESLTAKKVDGVRTAQIGKAKSLLKGVIAGFSLLTAIMMMN